jgi:7-alpha-hydroxysteroid dehydrogenase
MSVLDLFRLDDRVAVVTGAGRGPLRRLGTAADVAAAVVYLTSPAGAYLTGAVLEVHGGLQAPSTQQPQPDL